MLYSWRKDDNKFYMWKKDTKKRLQYLRCCAIWISVDWQHTENLVEKVKQWWFYHVLTWSDKRIQLLSFLPPHQSINFQNFLRNCLIGVPKKVQSRLFATFENLLFLTSVFKHFIFWHNHSFNHKYNVNTLFTKILQIG